MTREQQLEDALRWIFNIVDKELASDHNLRARGARTLRRIGDRAEDALLNHETGETK